MKLSSIAIASMVLCVPTLAGCGVISSKGKVLNAVARVELGNVNRSQLAYYLDHQTFASSLDELHQGTTGEAGQANIIVEIDNPDYHPVEIEMGADDVIHYAIATRQNIYETEILGLSVILPWHTSGMLYSYVGALHVVEGETLNEMQWASVVCRAEAPGALKPAQPIVEDNQLECASGTQGDSAPFVVLDLASQVRN